MKSTNCVTSLILELSPPVSIGYMGDDTRLIYMKSQQTYGPYTQQCQDISKSKQYQTRFRIQLISQTAAAGPQSARDVPSACLELLKGLTDEHSCCFLSTSN